MKDTFAVKESSKLPEGVYGFSAVNFDLPKFLLVKKGLNEKEFKITLGHEIFHSKFNSKLKKLSYIFEKDFLGQLVQTLAELYGHYFSMFKSFKVICNIDDNTKIIEIQ